MPTTTKNVKGKSYLYFTYYDPEEQKKKEIYCGLANNPESKNKALKLELRHLQKNKKELANRITEVETELRQLESSRELS